MDYTKYKEYMEYVKYLFRQTTDSGTIQGGRMRGILYSIYTSEIPKLYRLLDIPLYTKFIGCILSLV